MTSSLVSAHPEPISTIPSAPPYLLLGHTSSRIASLAIASLALGRGYSLPLLVAPHVEYRGSQIVRPMHLQTKKECAWFAREKGLWVSDWDWESGQTYSTGEKGKAGSIETLTQGEHYIYLLLVAMLTSESLADCRLHSNSECYSSLDGQHYRSNGTQTRIPWLRGSQRQADQGESTAGPLGNIKHLPFV